MAPLLRFVLIASQLLMASSTILAQTELWKLPNKKAIPPTESTRQEDPLPEESWHTPSVACSLLDENGLPTRGWKSLTMKTKAAREEWNPKDYSCSSPDTPLANNIPMLDGFIAYYVDGSEDTVRQLRLVLSIHDPRAVEVGSLSLAVISHALTLRSLERSLPLEIITALRKAEPGQWTIGLNQIEVQRENYVKGWGYDLKFLIR